MRYLIDGITKQTTALAGQWRHLRAEDEYRVYDETVDPAADGEELVQLGRYELRSGEAVSVPDNDTHDSRRFRIAADFAAALQWCDCYVSFESEPYILGNTADIAEATSRVERLLSRIEQAETAGKKIYLGNIFGKDFEKVVRTSPRCINTIITEYDLADMLEYRGSTFANGALDIKADITMIVGTNSASGKFSCMMACKEFYESKGETVCVVCTEETYPFLDNSDGTVYGFCRNVSDLTTDQDFQYLQGLICKIISEHRPDRIIISTQAGIGVGGVVGASQDTPNGQKMKGIWDTMIEHALGLDTIIIASNWNTLLVAEKIIRYYNIQGAAIDALYISPVTFGGSYIGLERDGYIYHAPELGSVEDVSAHANGMALKHPDIRIACNYADITDEVEAFRSSPDFLPAVASVLAEDIIASTLAVLTAEQQEYARNTATSALSETASCTDSTAFHTAAAAIKKALSAPQNENYSYLV